MGNVALEPLDTAIGDLLGLDPDTLCDAELHELVVGVQRQSHRLAALRAKLIATWDAREVWADDGSRSAPHRLSREASMAVGSAKTELRRARALRTMPHTAAAVANGDLSADHVDLMSRANDGSRAGLFAEHEATLVEQCKRLGYRDCYQLVEYWRQRADAEGCDDDAQRRDAGRTASAAVTIDGMVDVRAWLDPVGGAAFKKELDRLEHDMYLDDKRTGRVRTPGQRRADALVEMAHRSRTAQPGGLRPRPLITILVGEESFARTCELATGTVITPGQIVPHLIDADIERIIFDGPNRVISVSRRRRFTGALRRAIEVRDRHCQHPSGCDEPADNCDVDHITPYSQGGLTSQDDGQLECHPHNRDHDKHDKQPRTPPDADATDQHRSGDPGDDEPPDQRPPPRGSWSS